MKLSKSTLVVGSIVPVRIMDDKKSEWLACKCKIKDISNGHNTFNVRYTDKILSLPLLPEKLNSEE